MEKFTREYFKLMGSIGGKKANHKQGAVTMQKRHGADYFKKIRKLRKTY